MGSRTLPHECPHGVTLDWGDFGPDPDDGSVGAGRCETCEKAVEPTRLILLKPGDALAIGNLGCHRADDGLTELLDRLRAQLGLSFVYAFAEDITLEAVPLTPDETAAYVAAHPEVAARARQLAAEHGDGAA